MGSSTFAFEGLSTIDLVVRPEVEIETLSDGLILRDSDTGEAKYVPTDQKPKPGLKLCTERTLDAFVDNPRFTSTELGGGGFRTATAFKAGLVREGVPGDVTLLDSGSGSRDLAASCEEMGGINLLLLGRQETPRCLIIPWGKDRLIIKEHVSPCAGPLSSVQSKTVAESLSQALAVACVSSKDSALASAVLFNCNGATRYVQPTGSLSPEQTIELLPGASSVVCNFEEVRRLARTAGLRSVPLTEKSPKAVAEAHGLLRELEARGLAGNEAAICTFGRYGCLLENWKERIAYHIGIVMTDGSEGVPTPVGAGDVYLANWILFRETWAKNFPVRDPILAAAIRATRAVTDALGLSRDRYELIATPV